MGRRQFLEFSPLIGGFCHGTQTLGPPLWPEGVPRDITGYEKPLFSLLNESAKTYPNNTFTIFNGRFKPYTAVWETADRLAHFLGRARLQLRRQGFYSAFPGRWII
jgi:hypothetical protein